MKHLKIKLSVLALACLGAGAFALQPANYAKAEGETFDVSGLVMEEGAAVCLNDNFSGIRWTTTVNADWYKTTMAQTQTVTDEETTKKVYKGARFGVVVAPTGSFEGELTRETAGAVDLLAAGEENYFKPSTEEDSNYYSVISYDKLWEEYSASEGATMSEEAVMQAAYAKELTARAYIRMTLNDGNNTWVYYYADATVDTSRSARQVALEAELAGDLDAYIESNDATQQAKGLKAANYYGMDSHITKQEGFVVSNGAADTEYIDLEAVAAADTNVGVELTVADGYTVDEVLVGSKKVAATYADGTLTLNLTAGQALPTGETYLKVFAKNAESDVVVYTKPIIGATMVFDEMSDFDVFAKIRENVDQNGAGKVSATMQGDNVASDYEFPGYYVLAKNLTWNADTDTARTDSIKGWRGTGDFAKTKLGLTGTFNGLGRWIRGYQDGRTYGGLFQLVNGGTIKNTYFYAYTPTAKNASHFGHYVIDPTIENVFIYCDEKLNAQYGHYIFGNYLYQTEEGAAQLNNIYARVNYTSLKASANKGGLFSNYAGTTQNEYNWSNVYLACNMGAYYAVGTNSYIDVNGTEKAAYIPTFKAYAENQKTENGYTYYDPNYKGAPVALTLTEGGMTGVLTYSDVAYNVYSTSGDSTSTTLTAPDFGHCLKGVYVYYNTAAFKAAAPSLDFSAFTGVNGGNCWTVSDAGVLTWGN